MLRGQYHCRNVFSGWVDLAYDSIPPLELSFWSPVYLKNHVMLSRPIIHKQKRKFFHLSSISSYLLSSHPIFHNTTPIYLKSSDGRYREDMRRSNSFKPNWKRQQRPVMLSVLLRRQERWPRLRQGRKSRSGGLWRKRRKKNRWSIWDNSEMKY